MKNLSRRLWEPGDILNANARRKHHVESLSVKLLGYYSDSLRKERREAKECRYCYYVNKERVGGAAITIVNCQGCNTKMSFGNTCTDTLCETCATERKLCKRCGGKID